MVETIKIGQKIQKFLKFYHFEHSVILYDDIFTDWSSKRTVIFLMDLGKMLTLLFAILF